jgi:hypothetical protein
MVWFRRRRRRFLGTYVDAGPVEHAPVEQVVREGALISDSVVRMALRNRIIVDVLRDHRDLNRRALTAAAVRELEALADHEWESAERIRFRREPDAAESDREESERREHLHRAMSAAFAERADDREVITTVVERALEEAWSEIAAVIVQRAGDHALLLERDPHYEADLPDRLGAFIAVDLAGLAQERGVELS